MVSYDQTFLVEPVLTFFDFGQLTRIAPFEATTVDGYVHFRRLISTVLSGQQW